MRAINSTNFEQANVEFIEFWLLDTFDEINGERKDLGNLIFHLGNISEDILRDGRKAFENGLPTNGDYTSQDLTTTDWGYIPTTQVIVNAFDNNLDSRIFQDVGLDGMGDNLESSFYSNYISDLQSIVTDPEPSPPLPFIPVPVVTLVTPPTENCVNSMSSDPTVVGVALNF